MLDAVQIGLKISSIRKAKHLSQEDLADKLFVTRQALSKWETGLAIPSADTLLDICTIFNTSFEEILCLDDTFLQVDERNIFRGHNRAYIVNKLINNELAVDIPNVFYQLSPEERMLVLKAIKENKIQVNQRELVVKLTNSELKYLGRSNIICI